MQMSRVVTISIWALLLSLATSLSAAADDDKKSAFARPGDPTRKELAPAVDRWLQIEEGRLGQVLWMVERLGPVLKESAPRLRDLARSHTKATIRRLAYPDSSF